MISLPTNGHKGRFLDYVNNRLGISKSSYYYYMDYCGFMPKYRQFQSLSMSFRVFRSRIPKLREWFSSQECQALDASDFYSEKYWMNADEEVEDMEDDDMYMVSDVNSTEKQDKKRRWQEKRLISRFHVKKHPYKPQSRTVQWTRHLFFGVEELRQNIVANHHKQTLRYWFEYQSHESQKVLFSRNIYCEYLSLASRYNFDFESISLS